jgi:hypothetical protein
MTISVISTVFGGPGQPEPTDPNGGIFTARMDGADPGAYNADQYTNPAVRIVV